MPSNVRNRELSVARQTSVNDIVPAYVTTTAHTIVAGK